MKKVKSNNFSLNKIQRITIIVLVFSFLIYLNRNVLIYRNIISFLDTNEIEARIIEKKEGSRGSHLTGFFTYYYEFNVNNETFNNPSFNENYKIGDRVSVIYSRKFPFINKIKD
jgi:hypothetical protein